MSKIYKFNTGLEGKNMIQAHMTYEKNAGGYVAVFSVGDSMGDGLFGWHIDADYFRYYQKPQTRLLVPAARRSAKKEQEAADLMAANVAEYVNDFAASAEALGAPHMTISAA